MDRTRCSGTPDAVPVYRDELEVYVPTPPQIKVTLGLVRLFSSCSDPFDI